MRKYTAQSLELSIYLAQICELEAREEGLCPVFKYLFVERRGLVVVYGELVSGLNYEKHGVLRKHVEASIINVNEAKVIYS